MSSISTRLTARAGFCLLTLMPALSATARPPQAPPPASAFGIQRQSEVTLSPNGQLLAWRELDASGTRVIVVNLATRTVVHTSQLGPKIGLRQLSWASDDTLLLRVSELQRPAVSNGYSDSPVLQILAMSLPGGTTCALPGTSVLAWDVGTPHTVIISMPFITIPGDIVSFSVHGLPGVGDKTDAASTTELLAVDTRTCKSHAIGFGDRHTVAWEVDAHGNPVARAEWTQRGKRWSLLVRQGRGDWRQVYQHHSRDLGTDAVLTGVGIGADGGVVLAMLTGEDGSLRLWSAADGQDTKALPAASATVLGLYFSHRSGRPLGAWVGGASRHVLWFDQAAKVRYESLARLFPGREVTVYDHSADGKEVLAEVQGPANPPVYYLVNFATHRADIAGEEYPQLAKAALGKVTHIRYATADGRPVEANLFLPPGKDGKALPLVVLAPGGPEWNDPLRFDWLAQFLATRGYAVLRPEVLHSEFIGVNTPRNPVVEWGGTSQHYAADEVRALIRQGMVDPKRVCIAGIGYGGYAALAGVAFTPSLYACAISIDGVADLAVFRNFVYHQVGFLALQGFGLDYDYWKRELGTDSDATLLAESPVSAAGRITAPVLLLDLSHEAEFPRGQMQAMDRALLKLGKPVTFITVPSVEPDLSGGAARTEVLRDLEPFLARALH